MKIAEERYDPATRTFRSEGSLPGNQRIETADQQIDKNTRKWTLKVFENDRLVFTSEQLSKRIDESAEPSKP